MENFDLYWFRFKYEDSDEYKWRPCLILNNNIVRISKVTSNLSRIETPYYRILNWREAGLLKPSLIRLTKTLDIPKYIWEENAGELIGHLSDRDINNIKLILEGDLLESIDYQLLKRFMNL